MVPGKKTINSMEIIHVVLGKANPQRMNGVNKVVYQLATRQAEAGVPVSVWGITKNPEHNYPERTFETVLFKSYSSKFKLDPFFITALLRKKGKAVFHLHGGFNPIFFTIATHLKKHKIPFVFTPHGSYNIIAMNRSWLRKKIYIQLFEHVILSKASFIHCLGKSEVSGIKTIYSKAKTQLIPYGFENNASAEVNLLHSPFIIGFCGRIDIYTKGLDVLLKAFDMITAVIPEAQLWIIGDGEGKEPLQKLIQKQHLKNIHLWGSKFGEEKDALLKQMHVFAHPSRNEGLPSSVLEAASLGIPLAITEATNMGDSVRKYKCGSVINETNALELFNAIMNIYYQIKKEGMRNLFDASKQMVAEQYNWNTIIRQFEKMYQMAC
jgi:glycosyltransferase involved in cell wall biosynthesis